MHLEPDYSNVDEPEVAFSGFVVSCGDATGVLELVEASLNQVPQLIQPIIPPKFMGVRK